jgi:diguanylate cyclase (GGDEF)-like protein
LTGAFNRRKLDKEIEDRINKAVKPKNFSAILVDIDHFKSINDTCGYNGGDRALEDTAHLLQDVSNANDIVARYDVDEFCILTDTSDIKKLEALAERVRAAARSFNDSGKRPYKLFYSIGYAIYDQSSKMNLQQYIKLLDRNLSDDKRNNRQAEETADMDSLF